MAEDDRAELARTPVIGAADLFPPNYRLLEQLVCRTRRAGSGQCGHGLGGTSALRLRSGRERRDEGLAQSGVTVACFKCPLVPIGIISCSEIFASPAGQRKGRSAVPGLVPRKC